MKIFVVRKLYHENEKEGEILETLLWIFTRNYNRAIAFLYIILCYFQQIWQTIFYGRPKFCEGMKISLHREQNYLYPSFHLTLFFVCFILIAEEVRRRSVKNNPLNDGIESEIQGEKVHTVKTIKKKKICCNGCLPS